MKRSTLILSLLILLITSNFLNAQPGTLDDSFSKNGIKITNRDASDDYATSSAIQNDGKIVVTGDIYNPKDRTNKVFVARYNIDGTIDRDFGTNGKVTPDFNSNYAYSNSIAIQPDGKIIIVGYSYHSHGFLSNYDFTISRFNIDGSFDSSFGDKGDVISDFHSGDDNEYAEDIVLQPDGKLVVAGTSVLTI